MINTRTDINSSINVSNQINKRKGKMNPIQMLKDNMNKVHEKIMEESMTKDNPREPKTNKFEYVLEMGYVCVYTTGKDGERKLVDKIPLKEAKAEVLSRVQNINMMDILVLNDMKREDMAKKSQKIKMNDKKEESMESNNDNISTDAVGGSSSEGTMNVGESIGIGDVGGQGH